MSDVQSGRWDVPDGWAWTRTAEFSDVIGGGTPNASDESNFAPPTEGIPWLTPADLSGYRDAYISHGKRDLTQKGFQGCGAQVMPGGTVLFTSRAPIGYVAIADQPISTNQGFKSFVLPEEWVPEYLRYYLLSAKNYLESLASGSTFKELSGARAKEIEVPVAPANEQRRIVAKLDALFERSRNIRDKLDRIPTLLNKLRKSILAAATRSSSAWREVRLQDLCRSDRALTYGVIKLGNHMENGIPVLRSSNVRHLRLDTEDVKKVDPALSREYSRTILSGNEVLVTVRGTLGGVCAVGPEHAGWNVSREVASIPLLDEVNADYVAIAIASPKSQQWLKKVYKGVAYTGINIADLKNLPIALPSRAEQDAIVSHVRSALSRVESISGLVESSNGKVSVAESVFLATAFRGELVPQDPSDEPASTLLERIRADLDVQPAAKRTRRTKTTTRTA